MKSTTKVERITPATAQHYLESNKVNRALREGVVEKYAADMQAGRWTECVDPIVFDDTGDIADGQHRLWAIVESGVTVEFLVTRGLPKEARLNIDTGVPRTLVDNSRISGLDANLSNTLVAAALFYDEGKTVTRGLSNAARLEIINKHRAPLDWAIHNGPHGKSIRSRVTLAAVARAYAAGEDPERLQHFSKVLSTGFGDGQEDSAAIALRNYMQARQRFAQSEQRDLFLKVQNAIAYFLRRKPLTMIKVVKDEAFPLKKGKVPK